MGNTTRVTMVDVEGSLLHEIATDGFTRDDVAITYAFGIRDERDTIDWPKVNQAIIDRWSLSALTYIKAQAWKRVEGQR